MEIIVTTSVFSLNMDITACLCVTVMLHTVIMSTAVYSPQEVRFLIISLYLMSPMNDLKDSDRCCDTQFYDQVKVKRILGKKVMFIAIFYKSFFKTLKNDKKQILGFFLRKR